MRHKKHYFEATDNPSITRVILIMRKPKPKSRMRRIMWIAHHLKYE
jgi:hypothetical protein